MQTEKNGPKLGKWFRILALFLVKKAKELSLFFAWKTLVFARFCDNAKKVPIKPTKKTLLESKVLCIKASNLCVFKLLGERFESQL